MKPLQKKIIQRKISDAREQRRAERIRKTENPTEDRRAWRSTEKARRGLARVIFSRGFLIALLVLFQILISIVIFQGLPQYAARIQTFFGFVGVIVVIAIINAGGTDATKLTWMVFIMIFPIAGTVFYLYAKYDIGVRYIGKRLETLRVDTAATGRRRAGAARRPA